MFQQAADFLEQLLMGFGVSRTIEKAANGFGIAQFARNGLNPREHHEIHAHTKRLFQMGTR